MHIKIKVDVTYCMYNSASDNISIFMLRVE